jgi:hypothetical protein
VLPHLSRRRFGLGLAACALTAAADAAVPNCPDQLPDWAARLRADLEQMARELTGRLLPWHGSKRVLLPEGFGLGRDRKALATSAIQGAIDAAARGGGTVRLTRGDYISGTLDLRSNVRLEVAKGARLLASPELKDYPPRVAARPTVMDSNMGVTQSLLFAQGCHNISLCGEGVIDGLGTKQSFPGSETVGATPGRPFLIRVLDCQGVHVIGLHLRDAACWMQSYLNCEDLLIEHLRVENQANFNNDGLDIDGCRRVIIRGCDINSEDDALCFKGASQRPTEQVLVENCRLYSSTNGIKFGTDSQGDFRRILARNLEVGGPARGMRSLNPRRADSGVSWEVVDGGTAEDILASDIHIVRSESPLFLRLGDRGRVRPGESRPAPGHLRRIVFDRITGEDNGSRGSYFLGLPDRRIEDVVLQDVRLEVGAAEKPAPREDSIPEMRGDYPDAHMIGAVGPAYGLWARDVTRLTLSRVSFVPLSADPRPQLKMSRTTCSAEAIDRQALVMRHSPELTRVDPHAPFMIGNGSLGFTADITGLQTFPGAYAKSAPLLIMAQWSWHSFPNPHGYEEADGLIEVPVPGRGSEPYAWIKNWSEVDTKPALAWLRQNPHRFSLGRVGLALRSATGQAAQLGDLAETRQRLDLWTGTLSSSFVYDTQPVFVRTQVHPARDMVMVEIRSPLLKNSQLAIEVAYPGVSPALEPDPSDWTRDESHHTRELRREPGHILLQRQLDDTRYYSSILAPGARIEKVAAHRIRISTAEDHLSVLVCFDRDEQSAWRSETDANAAEAVAASWRHFWESGGAIDLSGSTDRRAPELERRIVLSQYLTAINCAGALPPQEEGLFANSWYGKFHLEMHPWHAAHFAPWGRAGLLERSLRWYLDHLPQAREAGALHRVSGAWWPKMVGPGGRNSPSPINPFIMWQQPHPIYLAEVVYRSRPDRATLYRYAELVHETARLLASWPSWDEANGRYVLGPPIIPVQETYDPLTTSNPAFELEYFRWGLQTAQRWRERLGLAREPAWDRVIARMAPVAERDGLYLPVEGKSDFWNDAASPTCKQDARAARCLNRDHPSFLMPYSLIGSDRLDPEAMRRTLRATAADWDLRQMWGWDFPMLAMVAARLGEPDTALEWLFKEAPNNQWSVNGMTPRMALETGSDTGIRVGDAYFPANGALLLAVGMMAAGWEGRPVGLAGSKGRAPGFPEDGWTVRVEGIGPCP